MILRWLDRISGVGFWLAAAGVCIIALLITVDIVLRAIGHFILGGYELVSIVMSIVVFASFAYGQREKRHIHVTMLIRRLPVTPRLVFFGSMSLLSTAVVGYLAYAAFSQAGELIGRGGVSGVLEIPLYPFYYLEGLAMALFTLVLLVDAARAFLAVRNEDVARDLMKHWS